MFNQQLSCIGAKLTMDMIVGKANYASWCSLCTPPETQGFTVFAVSCMARYKLDTNDIAISSDIT